LRDQQGTKPAWKFEMSCFNQFVALPELLPHLLPFLAIMRIV
jgi:hypothetical protein